MITHRHIALTVFKLSSIVVGMFVFALWVMPPIYDVFCDITGINRKVTQYQAVEIKVDTSRLVTVQFLATNNEKMPWSFKPVSTSIKVHPGAEIEMAYLAKNGTDKPMVGQAIPSVLPYQAAAYFHKTECFCFNQQPLQAGEEARLPLRFIVDQDLPPQVNTITLSYTLFDVTAAKAELLAENYRSTQGSSEKNKTHQKASADEKDSADEKEKIAGVFSDQTLSVTNN